MKKKEGEKKEERRGMDRRRKKGEKRGERERKEKGSIP